MICGTLDFFLPLPPTLTIFYAPSEVFIRTSNPPLKGLKIIPPTPLTVPLTKPLAPPSFAPLIGYSNIPVTPDATPDAPLLSPCLNP